jgi:hypothetical protein
LTEEILHFPSGFRWGSATAAHQVEGGNINNDWHAGEKSGNVYARQSASKACDWWNNAEARTGHFGDMADKGRTRHHNFSGKWSVASTDVKGKMLVFSKRYLGLVITDAMGYCDKSLSLESVAMTSAWILEQSVSPFITAFEGVEAAFCCEPQACENSLQFLCMRWTTGSPECRGQAPCDVQAAAQ